MIMRDTSLLLSKKCLKFIEFPQKALSNHEEELLREKAALFLKPWILAYGYTWLCGRIY
jgi:hypothetical protein